MVTIVNNFLSGKCSSLAEISKHKITREIFLRLVWPVIIIW